MSDDSGSGLNPGPREMRPIVRAAFEATLERYLPAYRYLADKETIRVSSIPDDIVLEPTVRLIARTAIETLGVQDWLKDLDAANYQSDATKDPEWIVEAAGRICFDNKTEILTPFGWRMFSEIGQDSPVATLNPDTRQIEWQVVEAVHVYEYDGELLEFNGRDVSFSVTPEHRQFAAKWANEEYKDYQFETTEALLGFRRFKVLTAPDRWTGGSVPSRIDIPTETYSQDISNQYGSRYSVATKAAAPIVVQGKEQVLALAELCAHYASNGSFLDQKGSGRRIVIYGREADRVIEIAGILGLSAYRWTDPRNNCPRALIGGGKTLMEYFRRECGQGCQNKKLPGWVLSLPVEHLELIWDVLLRTDGHTSEKGSQYFSSSSQTLIDQIQEILAKLGHSSSFAVKKGGNIPCFVMTKKSGQPAAVESRKVERVPYKGKVYCVTTHNGIVYVRRNGKVHFSGNCYSSHTRKRPGGNKAYIANLLDGGHGSVLEHASFTLGIAGISRSTLAQFTRHRVGLSPSVRSQRFCDEGGARAVLPPLLRPHLERWAKVQAKHPGETTGLEEADWDSHAIIREWHDHFRGAVGRYSWLVGDLSEAAPAEMSATDRRKAAHEAARSVLPECTETRMVVTGNARAWRHFLDLRGGAHADASIRQLAVAVHRALLPAAPNIFGDYRESPGPLGPHDVLVTRGDA